MKPSKSNIEKWCAALRSGEYKQGRGYLQPTINTFCCLGVACKVFSPEHPNANGRFPAACAPSTVTKDPQWLVDVNRDFNKRSGESLIGLNDSLHLTFDEIADCLEAVYIHEVLK